jgi:methionyl-tRNA formyltransferase
MIASRLGKKFTRRREADIMASYSLSGIPNPATPVTRVSSLNAPETIAAITRLQPAVVFTISCRILTRQTLAAIACPLINFHAGINPRYRGQMGGYWARIEGDEENFGATVHLVDAGVDTGGTLYEVRTAPARNDTISTYPLLLTAAGTGTAIKAIEDALACNLSVKDVSGPSVLRFPPPIWAYLYHGLLRGIW